jgi:flagellar biosynthesis protein FlhG
VKYQHQNFRNALKNILEMQDKKNCYEPKRNIKTPLTMAISGGKGGIGKTLTTANLGLALNQNGMRVLLIDGDFGLANLDVLFGVQPTSTLNDVLLGRCKMENVVVPVQNNLYLLPSSSGISSAENLSPSQKEFISSELETIASDFDFILVDTPAGVSENVKHWVSSCAETVIVASPEPTSLADAYATIKILSQSQAENSFHILVNMASSEREALFIFEKLSMLGDEFLKVKINYLGWIPFSSEVRHSVRGRVPFLLSHPYSEASFHLRQFASSVLDWKTKPIRQKGSLQLFWQKFTFQNNESRNLWSVEQHEPF